MFEPSFGPAPCIISRFNNLMYVDLAGGTWRCKGRGASPPKRDHRRLFLPPTPLEQLKIAANSNCDCSNFTKFCKRITKESRRKVEGSFWEEELDFCFRKRKSDVVRIGPSWSRPGAATLTNLNPKLFWAPALASHDQIGRAQNLPSFSNTRVLGC